MWLCLLLGLMLVCLFLGRQRLFRTARASMLVAMARRSIVLMLVSSFFSSSPEKASFSMFAPMNTNRAKAIQWSIEITRFSKLLPNVKPINGMSAWNMPKYRAMVKAFFQFSFFMDSPLHIDTAKASIASPMLISRISRVFIFCPFFFVFWGHFLRWTDCQRQPLQLIGYAFGVAGVEDYAPT